ncbi:MAG: oligoendopeptidase F [Acidobacteriota bacterium]
MKMKRVLMMVLIAFLAVPAASVMVRSRDRDKVPAKDQWDLSDLYKTDQAWSQAKDSLVKSLPELDQYKGELGSSAKTLKACLDLEYHLFQQYLRLSAYASQKSDMDMRNAKALEMRQSLGPIGAKLQAAGAWINPEILRIPQETIQAFYRQAPDLEKVYGPVIKDIQRMKPHTLSPEGERIVADAGRMSGSPESVYSVFSDADIPRSKVTLSDGKTVTLDAAAYTKYRAVTNRKDRQAVFQAFFGNLNKFRGTFGSLLNAEVNKDEFYAEARGYKSDVSPALAAALDENNIPVEVYTNLLKNVHQYLPVLHRYLKLRARIMGVKQLRYSDLYAPIFKDVDVKYTVPEAKKLVLKALAPLGKDYVDTLAKGYDSRWVDFYPTPGKHSGAYENAAYGVHPYMLLNFNGSYEDVSTLAHESGHAMHSHYSDTAQPFPTSMYKIFVAEVASTLNENLLMHYMLNHTHDDGMKLFLLGTYVDNLRTTLFRQAQFAEFELRIHQMVENGQALTGDNLNKVYAGILNKYYGVDQGICSVNPVCDAEWAYIPHFYYDFYVYSYATSITASTALARMIEEGRPGAVKHYRKFLTLGDSLPPVDELKAAGVDMTTDQPFKITMKAMNEAMDQMEAILNRMDKKAGK